MTTQSSLFSATRPGIFVEAVSLAARNNHREPSTWVTKPKDRGPRNPFGGRWSHRGDRHCGHDAADGGLRPDLAAGCRPLGRVERRCGQSLARRSSMAALRIAFCSFSKARTSIWRTRSRLMPYSWLNSSRVVGSSLRRRSWRM